ncbi:MAG: TIGR00730 family Rossman fold protein [Bacteroidota bacterium]
MTVKRVSVFCASSSRVNPEYFTLAKAIGKELAVNKIELVYGAGAIGLMGCIADMCLEHKGQVTGIIPYFMKELEWAHNNLTQLLLVDDMHERKKQLIMNTDAIVALPGGVGTLDELLEAITLKQLGQITIPIIIVNPDGFYDPLLNMFENLIANNFMRPQHRDIWTVITTPEELVPSLKDAPEWDGSIVKIAQM